MNKRILTIILIALLFELFNSCLPPDGFQSSNFQLDSLSEIIEIGDYSRTADLFSYPNNSHVVHYIDQTLEETIEHYVNMTLERDGYENAKAKLIKDYGIYSIVINPNGDSIGDFTEIYTKFLNIGDVGIKCARNFHKLGKWRYNWRFMLPLGLPMQNSRTLEVMDFPPITLLLERQDYLSSNTTDRWEELLEINGVKKENTNLYGAILDIVPVCAPAADGKKLEASGIYDGHFDDYALPLLDLWTKIPNSTASKPIMALGAPMRTWFEKNYQVKLKVLDVAYITLKDGRKVPVMGSNHPSYFFYEANKYRTGSNKDEKNLASGLRVLKKDIVASCWQAEMGKNPFADPFVVKQQCADKWKGREDELMEIVKKQAGF